MSGLQQHLVSSLRLHFRNRIALVYGYLFPLIFLVAFAVLYRHEKFPLIRHLGELLTVSVLGGACFGLPTTLVNERERGVWRRYRLVPISTWNLVVSTVVARYLIIVSAGLLQLGLALAIGMPAPSHPLGLFIAFSVVTFALIGLGLVIAMMADNVPAVQALGQCIFLPMLVIGGVAVQLTSLPVWAQHVAAFFPGRYAVEAMQASATGTGLSGAQFSLFSLLLIGSAGCLAGAKLFRWEAGPRSINSASKTWLVVALGAWLAVGLMAESRGRITVATDGAEKIPLGQVKAGPALTPLTSSRTSASNVTPSPLPTPTSTPIPQPMSARPMANPAPITLASPTPTPIVSPIQSTKGSTSAVRTLATWEQVSAKDTADLDYSVPPDDGIVAPMAPADETPEDDIGKQLNAVNRNLVDWAPDRIKDVVQRTQNCLCIAAVPDVVQLPVERFLPTVVLEHLEDNIPKADLIKVLTWIVLHPDQGTVISDTSDLGVEAAVGDPEQIRERVHLYALKFLIRLTDRKQ